MYMKVIIGKDAFMKVATGKNVFVLFGGGGVGGVGVGGLCCCYNYSFISWNNQVIGLGTFGCAVE